MRTSSFLVIGGAGSIGQAVVKEIFRRGPQRLHVVDISENNLVELVRDIRSQFGYIPGDFSTFALDAGSAIFDAFIHASHGYDYVLNLSALKHVRSEKDPFTLMRMIETNILNTLKTIRQSRKFGARGYFCVSTDKAANPVNMMGASKRIMEMCAVRESQEIPITMARFANVAFSDGSLLHGFRQRLAKRQPIVAPGDVDRYFLTPREAGELCLIACLLGNTRDIFFPNCGSELRLTSFADIAVRFLKDNGFEPFFCQTEDEARAAALRGLPSNYWPCLITNSDTTGEKPFEEFYTDSENVDHSRFKEVGVIVNGLPEANGGLEDFLAQIHDFRMRNYWEREELIALFQGLLPGFRHAETGKFLDAKM